MQPVAFLREAWRKWERKRSDKRKLSASAFNYRPSPRRSQTCSHRRVSSVSCRAILPKPSQISLEDYTKPVLKSHRWISIKRRRSSTAAKERTCASTSPICHTNSPASHHTERDDHVSDFHSRPVGSSRCHTSHPRLPTLKRLPESETNDNVYSLGGFKSERSSVSSYSSPKFSCLPNIAEKTDLAVGEQVARITARTTRLAVVPSQPPYTEPRHLTGQVHPKAMLSTLPKACDDQSLVPPEISNYPAETGDVQDFSLSLFPQPPPILGRKKVPKPLVLRPVRSSSSCHSLLPYSPLATPAYRPRSPSSSSQTSFSSQSKKVIGRPLTSVSPPPTSPPNSPLPSPPVDNRRDSNSFSTYSTDTRAGSVKYRLTGSGSIVDRPSMLVSIERPSTAL